MRIGSTDQKPIVAIFEATSSFRRIGGSCQDTSMINHARIARTLSSSFHHYFCATLLHPYIRAHLFDHSMNEMSCPAIKRNEKKVTQWKRMKFLGLSCKGMLLKGNESIVGPILSLYHQVDFTTRQVIWVSLRWLFINRLVLSEVFCLKSPSCRSPTINFWLSLSLALSSTYVCLSRAQLPLRTCDPLHRAEWGPSIPNIRCGAYWSKS